MNTPIHYSVIAAFFLFLVLVCSSLFSCFSMDGNDDRNDSMTTMLFFLFLFFLLSLSLVVKYRTNWRTIWSQPQIYSLKKFLTLYFLEKNFSYVWEMELSSRMIRKFIILFGLSPQNFFLKRFFLFVPKTTCS